MERKLWALLYRTVQDVAGEFQQKHVQIPGWVILVTMLWAASHDRPICWACCEGNWSTTKLRPLRIPSQPTMSRRVDSVAVGLLWNAVEKRLREMSGERPGMISYVDGKPLCVGGSTKDPDARYGRAAGVMAKGYKLHTVWSNRALPESWEITPMNTSELTAAHRLVGQVGDGGYLLGDGNYDSSRLFDDAWKHGYQMVIPLPKGQPGHVYQSPQRLRAIAMAKKDFGKRLYGHRIAIEEMYGNATSFGGGLNPLPAWVRGLERVRTWVWAKLLINAARIVNNQRLRQV